MTTHAEHDGGSRGLQAPESALNQEGLQPRTLRLLRPHLWLIGFFLMGMAANAYAQGCAQCLDSTQATPPAVQAAYRHAIYLLGGAGLALFLAGLYLFRRER